MKLYRKMFADVDGKPLVGNGRNMLGVRPANPAIKRLAADVAAVVGTDTVKPGEGLSTYDDPWEISPQVAGTLWVIEADELPTALRVEQRGKHRSHHHIEPAAEMALDELQTLLANTRDLWKLSDPGVTP